MVSQLTGVTGQGTPLCGLIMCVWLLFCRGGKHNTIYLSRQSLGLITLHGGVLNATGRTVRLTVLRVAIAVALPSSCRDVEIRYSFE